MLRFVGRPVRRTLTLVFAAATMLASAEGTAAAQGRAQAQGRALDLFEQSAKAYRDGRFQDAVDLLLEARKVKPEPVLLYNLGRAYEALGKPTEAADAYEQYLREDPRAADRKAIEGRVATLRAQAAELEKARTTPPPAASDERRDRTPEPAPPPKEDTPTIVPWIVAGAGVAVVGGGIVMGAVASSRHDDAVAEPRQAAAQDKQDSAESLATGATIMIVAGGVVAAVGLGWLGVRAFSASPAPSSARGVHVTPGLGSLVVGGRF